MLDGKTTIPFSAVILREIEQGDNQSVESLIRRVSAEFNCIGPGYSSSDFELLHMHETYSGDQSVFYVLEFEGKVLGCGGIAPLNGSELAICELRKMYFDKQLRGIGWGQELLNVCLRQAKTLSFEFCYLETMESMATANLLYQKTGFKQLTAALGNTGHSACDRWYLMELNSFNDSIQF